jgi:cbb3-type cytochrome oxidase subunit 3
LKGQIEEAANVKKYHFIIALLLLCLIGAVYRIFSLQERLHREETARQKLSDQKVETFFKPNNEPFVVDERLNRGLGDEY